MIYWAPLLHFYQPPTQLHWVLRKVCDECYRPLIALFRDLPQAKVTININASLTEMLDQHGMADVLEGLRALAARGQVEFTGSGIYHPILPLIPKDEMLRQIVGNHRTNRQLLGERYSPHGFFPPELAYGHDILGPVLETGHSWALVSGVGCPTPFPRNVVHEAALGGQRLAVFFRDDVLSNKISFKQIDADGFLDGLRELAPEGHDAYVITAMDAETFGHHIPHWEELFLARVCEVLTNGPRTGALSVGESDSKSEGQEVPLGLIRAVTISQLRDIFPAGQTIQPLASSWSTNTEDMAANNPYPLWKDGNNELHRLQWQHLRITLDTVRVAQETSRDEPARRYAEIARGIMDQALHSDQFWWATPRFRWDPNLVLRGLLLQREALFNAYKALLLAKLPEDTQRNHYHGFAAAGDLHNRIVDRLLHE